MTLDFDWFLRRKMAAIFIIMKPRRSYGYVLALSKRGLFGSFTECGLPHSIPDKLGLRSVIFYIDHFYHHIEPVKPKRHGYI